MTMLGINHGAKIAKDLSVAGGKGVDAAAWRLEDAMLLSIVNPAHQDVSGPVSVNLSIDVEAAGEISTLWGDGGWKFGTDADLQLRRNGMDALKADILLLSSDD